MAQFCCYFQSFISNNHRYAIISGLMALTIDQFQDMFDYWGRLLKINDVVS